MATAARRLLLHLNEAAPGAGGMAAAVRVARLLEAELCGIFVEDEALHALAALPFAREFRLPGHAWTPVEAPRFAGDLARRRRMLREAAAQLGAEPAFEVLRGDPADCLAGLCGAADILALAAPDSAAARAFGSFPRAFSAAIASLAAVMLLPAHPARPSGPVATVPDGASFDLALRLATMMGEDLLLLAPPGAPLVAAQARAHAAGLPAARIRTRPLRESGAAGLDAALGTAREALLVLGRDTGEAAAAPVLAARRRVPVLVL